MGDLDHPFSYSVALSEPKMSSSKALPVPTPPFWETQTHLIELPCCLGGRRAADARCTWLVGLWERDRLGTAWLSQAWAEEPSGTSAWICPLRSSGTCCFCFLGDEIQAGAAQGCGACAAELPCSSYLEKKPIKMNRNGVFWRGNGMCTLTFCFPFHLLSNPETCTNCS